MHAELTLEDFYGSGGPGSADQWGDAELKDQHRGALTARVNLACRGAGMCRGASGHAELHG
eukprot:4391749-Alexandrium_andersonii.AAC.1